MHTGLTHEHLLQTLLQWTNSTFGYSRQAIFLRTARDLPLFLLDNKKKNNQVQIKYNKNNKETTSAGI
jgi:hypothetical protein